MKRFIPYGVRSENVEEMCTLYPRFRLLDETLLERALLVDVQHTVRSPWLAEVLASMPEVLPHAEPVEETQASPGRESATVAGRFT